MNYLSIIANNIPRTKWTRVGTDLAQWAIVKQLSAQCPHIRGMSGKCPHKKRSPHPRLPTICPPSSAREGLGVRAMARVRQETEELLGGHLADNLHYWTYVGSSVLWEGSKTTLCYMMFSLLHFNKTKYFGHTYTYKTYKEFNNYYQLYRSRGQYQDRMKIRWFTSEFRKTLLLPWNHIIPTSSNINFLSIIIITTLLHY